VNTSQGDAARRRRAAIRAAAGAWKGNVDREQLMRNIREGREQDSPGRPA
jgi:hypothetical protein